MMAQFQPSQLHTTANIRLTMRALLATHEATRRMLPDDPRMDAYSAGFRDSLLLLAEALNVHLGIPAAHHYMER